MFEIPQELNTKQDYLNCLDLFPAKTKVELQKLIDERYCWADVSVLATGDAGVTDETHRVIGKDEKVQQEYKEDSNAKIFRLGFTVEEVKGLIDG